MARKRGETQSAVDRLLGDVGQEEPEEEAPAERETKGWRDPRDWRKVAKKYGKPTTYRLPEDLGDAIKERAEAEDVGISELAEILLRYGLAALDAGRLDLSEGD